MSTNNAVALVQPTSAQIVAMDDWSEARIKLVTENYCGGAPPATAAAFVALARRRRLSPEERQIYLIKRGEKWSIESAIDGFRLIADRSEAYAGCDIPIYGETIDDPFPHPDSATFTVYKIVQGQRVPFSAIAYWEEFFPKNEKNQFMWRQMPRQMLAKCAEAQALRKGFPADLSGIYVSEEMHQAEDDARSVTVRDVTPKGKGAATKAVAAQSQPAPDDDDLITIGQIKAIVDLGKRKRLGELDVAMLFGGEGWETRTTQGQAKAHIAWLQKATAQDVEERFAAVMAMEEAEASISTDDSDVFEASGKAIDAALVP